MAAWAFVSLAFCMFPWETESENQSVRWVRALGVHWSCGPEVVGAVGCSPDDT